MVKKQTHHRAIYIYHHDGKKKGGPRSTLYLSMQVNVGREEKALRRKTAPLPAEWGWGTMGNENIPNFLDA